MYLNNNEKSELFTGKSLRWEEALKYTRTTLSLVIYQRF
jgi:hypothetical protein